MMVRVPGQPAAVRVFTDAERADADTYAADTGGTVVPLPLTTSAEATAYRRWRRKCRLRASKSAWTCGRASTTSPHAGMDYPWSGATGATPPT